MKNKMNDFIDKKMIVYLHVVVQIVQNIVLLDCYLAVMFYTKARTTYRAL